MCLSGLDVDEIRIEGHASSEWRPGTPAEAAYVNNLQLSQDRAQAVLATCLGFLSDGEDRVWAQARTTAVGYSSARPVITDGREDATRSRRVMFNVALDRDRLIDDIGKDVAATQ
jgi:outer membrane protein OmpA-like peptidoglycan-associated protein